MNFLKKLIQKMICHHDYKLITSNEDVLSLRPNELLIYKCSKCGKLKFTTLSAEMIESKKYLDKQEKL